MYQSFYTGALGAGGCMAKMSVIANNLANINNDGYKPKNAAFSDLLNYNLNDSEEAVTELMSGNGVRMQRTYTGFDVAAMVILPLPRRTHFLWCRTRPQGRLPIQEAEVFTGESGKKGII